MVPCPLCSICDLDCGLCWGTGSLPRAVVERLSRDVQRLVNVIQAGDADQAALEMQRTIRLARAYLDHCLAY